MQLDNPDNKVHRDNMGPTWVLSALDGPMLAQWTLLLGNLPSIVSTCLVFYSSLTFLWLLATLVVISLHNVLEEYYPDSKVHGANMKLI